MTTGLANKLSMYLTCETFLLSRLDILKLLPNFEITYKNFHIQIAEIQNLSEQQLYGTNGIAGTRKKLKYNLAFIVDDNARKLHAFAHFANDYVLLHATWFTETDLQYSSDPKLIEQAKLIHTYASGYLKELTLYGITVATQSELSKAISDFKASLQFHPVSISDSDMIPGQIEECFRIADQSLQHIDALIEVFRVSVPDLYNAYQQSRRILGFETRELALKGTVTDAETNAPVIGAAIVFVRCDKSFQQPPVFMYSADQGDFYVQSLAEGTYEVKLNKIGYKELIVTSKVNKGESCQINTKMNRV